MNKVYAWYFKLGRGVGHAALDISFGRGPGLAEYVSWWPPYTVKINNAFDTLAGQTHTFPRDCGEEGGSSPDAAVEIRCLDENRMRAQWAAIRARGKYSLYYRNCAESVVEVLAAGGATLSADVRWFIESHTRVLWGPMEVIQLARMINMHAQVIEQRRAAGWQPEPDLRMSLPGLPRNTLRYAPGGPGA